MMRFLRFAIRCVLVSGVMAIALGSGHLPMASAAQTPPPAECLRITGSQGEVYYNPATGQSSGLQAPNAAQPILSPDRRYAADFTYARTDTPNSVNRITITDTATGNLLSQIGMAAGNFVWSPDSKHYAFFMKLIANQAGEIGIGEPESGIRIMVPEIGEDEGLSWSPDSLYLAFVVLDRVQQTRRLGFVSAAGDSTLIYGAQNLYEYTYGDQRYWSHRHLFASFFGDPTGHSAWLGITDPATGKVTRLDTPQPFDYFVNNKPLPIDWPPDDTHVVVTMQLASTVPRVYVFSVDSPKGHKVGELGMPILEWSADGNTLYHVQDGDTFTLQAYHIKTNQSETLSPLVTMVMNSIFPFPDKRSLVFLSDQRTISALQLDSQKVAPLVSIAKPDAIDQLITSKSALAVLSHNENQSVGYSTRIDLINLDMLGAVRLFPDGSFNVGAVATDDDAVPFVVWSTPVERLTTPLQQTEAPLTVTIEGFSSAGKSAYRFVTTESRMNYPDIGSVIGSHNRKSALLLSRGDSMTILKSNEPTISFPENRLDGPRIRNTPIWSVDDTYIAMIITDIRMQGDFAVVVGADGKLLVQSGMEQIRSIGWTACPASST